MTTSSLTIRLESELKEAAAQVADSYGLDLSTTIRAFLTEIVNTNTLPLSFDYLRPNEESLRAIRETQEMIDTGSGENYSSGRDLIEAALK